VGKDIFSIYLLTLKTNYQKEEKMSKKIPITLFLTVVIAIVALFAATAVMAQERPVICQDLQAKYTITPHPDYEFPYQVSADEDECGGKAGWVWRYRVEVDNPRHLAKVNKGYFYIPSSPPNIIEVWDAGYRGEPGTSGVLGLNYNGIVVTTENISGSSTTLDWVFCAKEKTKYGVITLVLDTGSGELPCLAKKWDAETETLLDWKDGQGFVGGIVGPGFDISELVLAETTRDVDFPAGGCVRIKKHPVTGCIKEFRRCNNGDNGQGNLIPGSQTRPNWITTTVEDLGNFEARLCRDGIIAGKRPVPGEHSDIEYWGYANGWWYCIGTYSTEEPWWCNDCGACP